MTWDDMVEKVAAVGKVPKKASHMMLRAAFSTIAEEAIHGRRMLVPGFGVFTRRMRKTRTIRNPKTRELMQLGESISIGFRCSSTIKR
jgi:nucleoid DNA-binding protein